MTDVVILVPIYKSQLDDIELFSLKFSIAQLKLGRKIKFICPRNLDISFYLFHFESIEFDSFPDSFFESVLGYNQLLLQVEFYRFYSGFKFLLILQTDAIILRDELDFWVVQSFDYVGAPWPAGLLVELNRGRFAGEASRQVRVHVGNGGYSLRRIDKTIELLLDFEEEVAIYFASGFDNISGRNEDVFFAAMAQVSGSFHIPDPVTASLFSTEYPPDYYLKSNGNRPPSGGHAWWKFNREFWIGLMDVEKRPDFF